MRKVNDLKVLIRSSRFRNRTEPRLKHHSDNLGEQVPLSKNTNSISVSGSAWTSMPGENHPSGFRASCFEYPTEIMARSNSPRDKLLRSRISQDDLAQEQSRSEDPARRHEFQPPNVISDFGGLRRPSHLREVGLMLLI